MDKSLNQQQTLYTFVSIRPPEIFTELNKAWRFVLHPGTGGEFFTAVQNRPQGQSKWEAMKIKSQTFVPYTSTTELITTFGNNATTAQWLAQNKYKATNEELNNAVRSLTKLTPALLLKVWDNFFYQVVTQKEFYVKELISEILITENLIVQMGTVSDPAAKIANMKIWANARVVLPEALFDDAKSDDPVTVLGPTDPVFSTKKLDKDSDIANAQYNINRNNKAVADLKKLQAKYNQDYDTAYTTAYTTYNTALKTAYNNATLEEKTRVLCPSDCVETYWVYNNLTLPAFTFTVPTEVTPAILTAGLTEESNYVVVSLGLQNNKTFDSIIFGVQASTRDYVAKIYNNLPSGKKTVTIGGMTFTEKNLNASNVSLLTNLQVPYTASFVQTSASPLKGKVQVTFDLGYANGDVASALYTATFTNGTTNTNGAFSDSSLGNTLTVLLFPADVGVAVVGSTTQFNIDVDVILTNGTKIEFATTLLLKGRNSGVATITNKITQNVTTAAFVPKKFGVRRLGIADYKKVVAEVCCYREAEVSHIENIMAREFKSKTTTRERIEETTTTTENEYETENLTDVATSERFEMQSEVAKVIAQQKEFGAYGTVSGGYGGIKFETGANYATATAKEESNRQAITQGKEITQRASERITSRFRESLVKKITESFKEENSHVFDNRAGENHVSGIYRYINAIYKNSIFNYGKRLIYEFMVPEPSRLYRYGMEVVGATQNQASGPEAVLPPKPQDLGITSASDIDDNYLFIAGKYGAQVEAPPTEYQFVGKAYTGKGQNASYAVEWNDLTIPDGYRLSSVKFNITFRRAENSNINVHLSIGNYIVDLGLTSNSTSNASGRATKYSGNVSFVDNYTNGNTLPISVATWDVAAITLNVSARVDRTPQAYQNWQAKTYDAIIAAYRDRLAEYYAQVSTNQDEGATYIESNPLFYRQIEQAILKKICVSYIMNEDNMGSEYYTGTTFTTFKVTQSADMENYANFARFMEQAFEWNIMSYNFYPYYWGNRENWVELFQSEDDDAAFRAFMQAGMARVTVTVRPGFEDAVMHYMRIGQIWNGGQVPIIGDKLYMSIADELKEQEYTVEETWETVVPTSLIGIQKEGLLVDINGLPCGDGCEIDGEHNPLVPNSSKLGPGTTPTT